jgi:hypothetical protein
MRLSTDTPRKVTATFETSTTIDRMERPSAKSAAVCVTDTPPLESR